MTRRLLLVAVCLAPIPALAARRRDNPEECERIDRKMEEIDAERRMGYTARRGRRLLTQRETLERKRRQMCR